MKLPPSNKKIDRKSTRLNSSHGSISYAVFCLKKKKITRSISMFDNFFPISATRRSCPASGSGTRGRVWVLYRGNERATHELRFFFFFNDTATTEIYTLSLHDALPIYAPDNDSIAFACDEGGTYEIYTIDRKSTRLNSSHGSISYAVFCLKKKT